MSVISLKNEDFDTYSITVNPERYYSSSSFGVTGSVKIYPRRSGIEKDLSVSDAFLDTTIDDTSLVSYINYMQAFGRFVMSNESSEWDDKFTQTIEQYLKLVNEQNRSSRKFKELGVNRFTPGVRWNPNYGVKLTTKNVLNKYYRVMYPSAQWACTNYNSINFFTSSQVPNGSALLYPMKSAPIEHEGYATGSYVPSGSFSFDFYINPRYKTLGIGKSHSGPGTIMQVPGVFALSLLTGSNRDVNNKADLYHLLLQVKHSSNINPLSASHNIEGNYPYDLIFLSEAALKYNHWHHVVVRWGTDEINNGTGSFNIDGIDRGTFVIPSGTIAMQTPVSGWMQPQMLCVGNYFEPINGDIDNQDIAFFGQDVAKRDGILQKDFVQNLHEPSDYQMKYPLCAEMHDVSIKRYYMDDLDITVSSSVGPKSLDTGSNGIAFYLPPFFTEESPFRQYVVDHGGILQTPFFEVDGTTNDPFNVAMAFGVNGHYINLENYVRDFASNNNPRLHQLSGTAITYTTQAREANEFLYDDSFIKKRNLTILPCDDGLFRPSYELLESESMSTKFINDLNNKDYSLINLDNLLSTSSLLFGTDFQSINGDTDKSNSKVEEFVNNQVGFTPENPGLEPGSAFVSYKRTIDSLVGSGTFDPGVQAGAPLTIYNRTQDSSSNQVTFFDFSNLFFGDNVKPGTFVLTDNALTGSDGHIGITLKDDGYGNLYRANCYTTASSWNNVGNIYYNEGLVVIKNPTLNFFGKEQFEISFKGSRRLHVLNINVVAGRNEFNSSSNPNWLPVSASTAPTDPEQDFVYITGINYHDDNMNVVMKTQLAQPVEKRFGNKIAFKTKIDW